MKPIIIGGVQTNTMAHSNKANKKVARGGKTRHQERKSQRASQQQERYNSVVTWVKNREEEKLQENKTSEIKTISKKPLIRSYKAIVRRSVALTSLYKQLELGTKVLSNKSLAEIPNDAYLLLLEAMPLSERNIVVPLTEGDKNRINKEIAILKVRKATIVKPVVVL